MSWIIFASQFIGPPSRFRGIEAGLLKKTGLVIALICNVSFARLQRHYHQQHQQQQQPHQQQQLLHDKQQSKNETE